MISPQTLTPELSELLGIIVGDGYIRTRPPRWLSIECSAHERDYIDNNVISLIKNIFDIEAKGRYFNRKGIKNTYGICITRKHLVEFLTKYNVHLKHNIIGVPVLILGSENLDVKKSFLRGYIDTDGCMSFIKKSGKYSYPRLNVSSVSKELMLGATKLFYDLGFRGSLWTAKIGKKSKLPLHRFEIKGNEMIERWASIIGTKNPSILSKYQIWKKYGFCMTNLSYMERIKILSSEENNIDAPVAQFG